MAYSRRAGEKSVGRCKCPTQALRHGRGHQKGFTYEELKGGDTNVAEKVSKAGKSLRKLAAGFEPIS